MVFVMAKVVSIVHKVKLYMTDNGFLENDMDMAR